METFLKVVIYIIVLCFMGLSLISGTLIEKGDDVSFTIGIVLFVFACITIIKGLHHIMEEENEKES